MDRFFELRDEDGAFSFSEEKFQILIEVLATNEDLERLQRVDYPILDDGRA